MDISSLRERAFTELISVSELNGYIKKIFENDRALTALSVRGEISNLVHHKSGHLYFSLKDADGQIRAVMFRSSAVRLKFNLENGMRVVVRGSVSIYTKDGSYQIYVNSAEPDGIGGLYLAYEQLKARLEAEGLFDEYHKKLIPEFATRIGIITSPTGAAVRDIINVSKRRFPGVKLYLYPSLVQGNGAEDNLIKALDYFEKSKLVDVIIIGRGGGSIEDLWAFNSESLARKIYEIKTPIISAVGHETDFTICDFVADLRAPTPSAAAELAVPDSRSILRMVDQYCDRCEKALVTVLEKREMRLENLTSRLPLENPEELFSMKAERVNELYKTIKSNINSVLNTKMQALTLNAEKSNALSPLLTLSRGYSLAEQNGLRIKSVNEIDKSLPFSLVLSDGRVLAEVIKTEKGT